MKLQGIITMSAVEISNVSEFRKLYRSSADKSENSPTQRKKIHIPEIHWKSRNVSEFGIPELHGILEFCSYKRMLKRSIGIEALTIV
jgi:hypothetical protein